MKRNIVEQVHYEEIRYNVFHKDYTGEDYEIHLERYFNDDTNEWSEWTLKITGSPYEHFTELQLRDSLKILNKVKRLKRKNELCYSI